MTNNWYQKHKEKIQKDARERYQIFLRNKKIKGEKMPETDIKFFM